MIADFLFEMFHTPRLNKNILPIVFLHEKAAFLPEGGLISKSNQLINSKKKP
jgi:hypothetical protein